MLGRIVTRTGGLRRVGGGALVCSCESSSPISNGSRRWASADAAQAVTVQEEASSSSSSSSSTPASSSRRKQKPSLTQAYLKARKEAFQRHEKEAQQAKLPWRIVVAGLIERLPIIMRDPEPWEVDFFQVQEELMKYGKAFPKDTGLMGSDDIYAKSDNQAVEELPFKLAPRITKADRLNDRTTLNRALAERLFLLVKSKTTGTWDVPRITVDGKGPMRKAQGDLITQYLGEKFEASIPSNAPVGFHWQPLEDGKPAGFYGDKIFFYRLEHIKGRGKVIEDDVEEYVWVTRGEVEEYVKDGEYAKLLTYIM